MERYSNLYGTVSGGAYSPLATSESLPLFLKEIGAVNLSATVTEVRNVLAGFPKMDTSAPGFGENYYAQPRNDKPVAVRYAPMHLYKRQGMPSDMKPFCAICINGNENKQADRVTVYSQTYFIAREHMHGTVTEKVDGEAVTFNYLDQIFGTQLLNHTQVADFREGRGDVDLEALPRKVMPQWNQKDAPVVMNTLAAVFAEKATVIRLESGCGFNSRAWELLIPIYALMPPRLAAEIGFATYQEPGSIAGLVADTSMRIFLVPAECDLKQLAGSDMQILDLNEPAGLPPVPGDALGKMLVRWSRLAWPLRQEAMGQLFADTQDSFNDPEVFIQRSRDFFSDPFFQWERSDEDKHTVTTLAQLKEIYDRFPLCAQIGWVGRRFQRRIPALLAKGTALKKLTAETLALALYGEDEQEKKVAQDLYRFGMELDGVDTIPCAREAARLHAKVETDKVNAVLRKTQAQMEENSQSYQAEKAALLTAHSQKLDAVHAEHAQAIRNLEDDYTRKCTQAEEEHLAKIQALESGHAQLVQSLRTENQQKLLTMEQGYTQRIEDLNIAHTAQVDALNREYQQQLTAMEQTHQTQVDTLNRQHQTAEAALNQQLLDTQAQAAEDKLRFTESLQNQKALTDAANRQTEQVRQELAAEKTAHDATRADRATVARQLDTSVAQYEKAKDAFAKLKEAKAESDRKAQAADDVRRQGEQMLAEAQRQKEELAGLRSETERAKAKAQLMIDSQKKRSILFGAIGFFAAVLVCGGILLTMTLLAPEEPEPVDPITIATTQETTTEATTEVTTAPTTLPTEPPKPDMTDWSGRTAAVWLLEQLPQIQGFTLNPETVELALEENEQAVALFQLENPQDYLVLALRAPAAAPADPAQAAEGEETAATEETASEEIASDEVAAAEEAAPETASAEEMPRIAGNELALLTGGEFRLAAYGSGDAVLTARDLLALLTEDAEPAQMYLNLGGYLQKADALMSTMEPEGQWWQGLESLNADTAIYDSALAVLGDAAVQQLCLDLGRGRTVLLVCLAENADVQQLKMEVEEAGFACQTEGRLLAVTLLG